MLDSYNQQQIETISIELLRRSKAWDVFPTPVDRIVSTAELAVADNIDLSQVKRSFLERITDGAKGFVKNVARDLRGVLDRKKRVIYLDMSVGETRKNFVKLHETGHELFPWQKEILNCLDDDQTLNPAFEEEFEAEANFFASLTLFQQDRFDYELKQLELGIPAAKFLAKKFGASIHATLRRLVERTSKRCALLVLEKPQRFPHFSCKVRDYFQSEAFSIDFGELEWDEELRLDHELSFIEMYSFGKRYSEGGKVTIHTVDESISLRFHYFNNTYNVFVLLFPEGENTPTRTKILIKGTDAI